MTKKTKNISKSNEKYKKNSHDRKTPNKKTPSVETLSKRDSKIIIQDLFNSHACINDENFQKSIEKAMNNILHQIYKYSENNKAIKIWVDGSYNSKSGAAGIGIVIVTDDRYGIDQKHNIAFGKTVNAESSVNAEIYALSIGLSYILDTFAEVNNIHVYYDCVNSTVCATNINAFAEFGAPYTNFKSALKRIKRRKMNVAFEHTKAHATDMNNEICDLLAKHYAKAKLQNSQRKLISKFIEKGVSHQTCKEKSDR